MAEKPKRKAVWKISNGDGPELTDNGNPTIPSMYVKMDDMAQYEKPIIIETDSEYYLSEAAGYAAQKGYELVSPLPEQNLIISDKINKMAGEEIAEGHLGPSLDKQKVWQVPVARKLDNLSDGFDTAVQVEHVEHDWPDGGKIPKHEWFANRVFYRTDVDNASPDKVNSLVIESYPFSSAEEADEKAKEMANRSADRRLLQAALTKEFLPDHHKEFIKESTGLSVEHDKSLDGPESIKQESTADIVADIGRIANQPMQPMGGIPRPKVPDEQQPINLAHPRQVFPEKLPPDVLEKRAHIAAVKDYGNRITITRMGMAYVNPAQKRDRDARVERSLEAARARFGDPVRVEGNSGFEKAVIKAAIAQGIPLEMASKRGLKAYELALQDEKKRGLEKTMGTLGQVKDRVKEKNVSKGRGLEL